MPGDVQTSGETDQICYIWVSGERSPLSYGFVFAVSQKRLKDGSDLPHGSNADSVLEAPCSCRILFFTVSDFS